MSILGMPGTGGGEAVGRDPVQEVMGPEWWLWDERP